MLRYALAAVAFFRVILPLANAQSTASYAKCTSGADPAILSACSALSREISVHGGGTFFTYVTFAPITFFPSTATNGSVFYVTHTSSATRVKVTAPATTTSGQGSGSGTGSGSKPSRQTGGTAAQRTAAKSITAEANSTPASGAASATAAAAAASANAVANSNYTNHVIIPVAVVCTVVPVLLLLLLLWYCLSRRKRHREAAEAQQHEYRPGGDPKSGTMIAGNKESNGPPVLPMIDSSWYSNRNSNVPQDDSSSIYEAEGDSKPVHQAQTNGFANRDSQFQDPGIQNGAGQERAVPASGYASASTAVPPSAGPPPAAPLPATPVAAAQISGIPRSTGGSQEGSRQDLAAGDPALARATGARVPPPATSLPKTPPASTQKSGFSPSNKVSQDSTRQGYTVDDPALAKAIGARVTPPSTTPTTPSRNTGAIAAGGVAAGALAAGGLAAGSLASDDDGTSTPRQSMPSSQLHTQAGQQAHQGPDYSNEARNTQIYEPRDFTPRGKTTSPDHYADNASSIGYERSETSGEFVTPMTSQLAFPGQQEPDDPAGRRSTSDYDQDSGANTPRVSRDLWRGEPGGAGTPEVGTVATATEQRYSVPPHPPRKSSKRISSGSSVGGSVGAAGAGAEDGRTMPGSWYDHSHTNSQTTYNGFDFGFGEQAQPPTAGGARAEETPPSSWV